MLFICTDLEPRQGDSWGGNQEEDRQSPGLHGTNVPVGVFSLEQPGFRLRLARLTGIASFCGSDELSQFAATRY